MKQSLIEYRFMANSAATIAPQPDRIGFAITMAIAGTLTIASTDLTTKWLTSDLSLWQLQSMRSAFGIIFLLVLLILMRKLPSIRMINTKAVIFRSVLMTASYLAFFTALAVLPIAVVAGGYFSAPLFMVLLSAVMLKESIGIWRLSSVLAGFIGVLLIVQPDPATFDLMLALPVICAFFYALTQVFTRKYCKEETPVAMSFWLAAVFLVSGILGIIGLALLPVFPEPDFLTRPLINLPLTPLLVLVAVSIASVAMHFALAAAYQNAPASLVSPLEYLYLPAAIVGGYLFFDEVPNAMALVGTAIIIMAGLTIAWRERLAAKQRVSVY